MSWQESEAEGKFQKWKVELVSSFFGVPLEPDEMNDDAKKLTKDTDGAEFDSFNEKSKVSNCDGEISKRKISISRVIGESDETVLTNFDNVSSVLAHNEEMNEGGENYMLDELASRKEKCPNFEVKSYELSDSVLESHLGCFSVDTVGMVDNYKGNDVSKDKEVNSNMGFGCEHLDEGDGEVQLSISAPYRPLEEKFGLPMPDHIGDVSVVNENMDSFEPGDNDQKEAFNGLDAYEIMNDDTTLLSSDSDIKKPVESEYFIDKFNILDNNPAIEKTESKIVVQYITDEILSYLPLYKDSKVSYLVDQTGSQDVNANSCMIDEFENKNVKDKAKKNVVIDVDESEESGDESKEVYCGMFSNSGANIIVGSILANVLDIVADTVAVNYDCSRLSILRGKVGSKIREKNDCVTLNSLDVKLPELDQNTLEGRNSFHASKKPSSSSTFVVSKDHGDDDENGLIDASKVPFACLDVRLKTGFPAKTVQLGKNCLSIILKSDCRKEDRLDLVNVTGFLGCGLHNLKFYSQSKIIGSKIRKDFVFESEIDAEKADKYLKNHCRVETFRLTESELGFSLAPSLSEAEMMSILDASSHEKKDNNFMSKFDGTVEQNDGDIFFKFSSLANLNLFLYHLLGASNAALGLFRKNFTDKQQLVLAPSKRFAGITRKGDNSDQMVFQLFVEDNRKKNRRKKLLPCEWELLAKCCNFELEQASLSENEKILIFISKLAMYKFWTGFTAKILRKARIYDLTLEKHDCVEIISEKVSERLAIDLNLLRDSANANDMVSENVLKCVDDVIYEREEVEVPSISSEENIEVEESTLGIQTLCSTIVIESEECGTSRTEETPALETEIEASAISAGIKINEIIDELQKVKNNLMAEENKVRKLEAELKEKTEMISELQEWLVCERKDKLSLEAMLPPQDMQRRIQEEIDQETREFQESNLANFDWKCIDYFSGGIPSSRNIAGKRERPKRCLAISNPQIKLSSILGLTWKKEVANGSNFIRCVVSFLKSISRSLSSVFMEDGDVVLCMKSPALLRKALFDDVRKEVLDQGFENLTPRMRLVPDYLFQDYKLDIFLEDNNLNLQSRKDLVLLLSRAGGSLKRRGCDEQILTVSFKSLIAFVRALTNTKLLSHHKVFPRKVHFEHFSGNGENNYFKGQVCLTESNLLSIHYIGEQEQGFARCFSKFLQDSRIHKVDVGKNGRIVVMFYNLKALEDCLSESCQYNCNTLAKLVHQSVRSSFSPRNTYYSLMCPSTASKKDFACYKDTCMLEDEPRRISSQSKLQLVEVLRDVQGKYPDVHFSENNFFFPRKKGQQKRSQSLATEEVDTHEAYENHPFENADATSDYDESIVSEPNVGAEVRH